MSLNVNSVIVGGRLGRDPEVKFGANGDAICRFSVAVDEGRKDGERHTNWVDCTAFGKTGETVGQYLTKGAECVVEGRLNIRKFVDKEGNNRVGWSVIANRVHFGSKPQGEQHSPHGRGAAVPPGSTDPGAPTDDGDLIPF